MLSSSFFYLFLFFLLLFLFFLLLFLPISSSTSASSSSSILLLLSIPSSLFLFPPPRTLPPPHLLLSNIQAHCQFLQLLQEQLQTALTAGSHLTVPLHTSTPTHLPHTTSWRKLSAIVNTTAASLIEAMRRMCDEVRGQGSKVTRVSCVCTMAMKIMNVTPSSHPLPFLLPPITSL